MELQLKNIGMIKEANVKIDGLTVIAGENDTGKSTVGKALYLYIKARQWLKPSIPKEAHIDGLIDSLFQGNISKEGYITLDKDAIKLEIKKNRLTGYNPFYDDGKKSIVNTRPINYEIMIIETPIVLNLINLYYQINQAEKRLSTIMDFPELMYDLIFYLENKRQVRVPRIDKEIYINQKTIKVMGGTLQRDINNNLFFNKSDKRIELINTATGIKYFGILQLISENGWLDKNTVLVLDEPEVHLHPKWQLEMAKIIVELVEKGVKIVVNSHSPYMIEALKRYSEVEEVEDKTNFYLAENGYIEHQESLEEIFEKLALPMRELKKLKMDKYLND